MVNVSDSKRLRFALMGPADANDLFELDQDPAVMRYINGGKVTSWEDIENVFLPRMAAYTDAEKGWGLWKVLLADSDTFIGWILVRPMYFFSEETAWEDWELGWRFKQAYWGFGYATEAAHQVMNALKNQAQMTRFSAIAMPDNAASIAIMKKLGMHYIKTDLHKDPLGDEEVVY